METECNDVVMKENQFLFRSQQATDDVLSRFWGSDVVQTNPGSNEANNSNPHSIYKVLNFNGDNDYALKLESQKSNQTETHQPQLLSSSFTTNENWLRLQEKPPPINLDFKAFGDHRLKGTCGQQFNALHGTTTPQQPTLQILPTTSNSVEISNLRKFWTGTFTFTGTYKNAPSLQPNSPSFTSSHSSPFNHSTPQTGLQAQPTSPPAVHHQNFPLPKCTRQFTLTAYAPNPCSPEFLPLIAKFERTSLNKSLPIWPSSMRVCGICCASNLNIFKKYCVGIYIFIPNSDSTPEELDFFRYTHQTLSSNHLANVVDLPTNTLLLSPLKQDRLLGMLLTKMNLFQSIPASTSPMPPQIATNPNVSVNGNSNPQNVAPPSSVQILASTAPLVATNVSPAPTNNNHEQQLIKTNMSYKYHKIGELDFTDRITDGFYDPGRSCPFQSLEEYTKQPIDLNCREILLIDTRIDKKLVHTLRKAQEMNANFADTESQARVLALFVSNCFGGTFPAINKSKEEIVSFKKEHQSNIILLGENKNDNKKRKTQNQHGNGDFK